MKFSERYGYSNLNKELQRGKISEHLQTRLWNIIYDDIVSKIEWPLNDSEICNFFEHCWDSIFKLNIRDFKKNTDNYYIAKEINLEYNRLKWYEVFDLLEEIIKNFKQQSLKNKFNQILNEEKSAYRIVNNQVVEIISEEEIKEIEAVFNQEDKFNPVKIHIGKAIKFLSNREKPDYENSIKESISSLESLAKIILSQKGTLGDLVKKFDIHPALKESIGKLYGWTSDDGGIRHGNDGKGYNPDEEEARLILILSSALINYIIAKRGRKNEN
ncbi:hypothetical protein KAI04_02980 [Candidatus Pacearchaeota archaeon]|nr:hypothetical protein [Candidatus Pacearchaeota archaeon]